MEASGGRWVPNPPFVRPLVALVAAFVGRNLEHLQNVEELPVHIKELVLPFLLERRANDTLFRDQLARIFGGVTSLTWKPEYRPLSAECVQLIGDSAGNLLRLELDNVAESWFSPLLARCTQLRTLSVGFARDEPVNGYGAVLFPSSLTSLHFKSYHYGDVCMRGFEEATAGCKDSLQSLTLGLTGRPHLVGYILSAFTRLRHLKLNSREPQRLHAQWMSTSLLELDMATTAGTPLEQLSKLHDHFPNLVSFSAGELKQPFLKSSKLEELHFEYSQIAPSKYRKCLKKLPNLVRLTLSSMKPFPPSPVVLHSDSVTQILVNGSGPWGSLSMACPCLTQLTLVSVDLDDSAFKAIFEGATSLTHLSISHGAELANGFISSTSLRELTMHGCRSLSSLDFDTCCSSLEILRLRYCEKLGDEGLLSWTNLVRLHTLRLKACTRLSSPNIHMPALKELEFMECAAIPSIVCPELWVLKLNPIRIADKSWSSIGTMLEGISENSPYLRHLVVEAQPSLDYSPTEDQAILNFPMLEGATLHQFPSEALDSIAKFSRHLRKLEWKYGPISGTALDDILVNCTELLVLDISDPKSLPRRLRLESKSLTKLSIQGSCSQGEVLSLDCPKLKHLNLMELGYKILAEFIDKGSKELEYLKVGTVRGDLSGLTITGDAFPLLTELNLGGNGLPCIRSEVLQRIHLGQLPYEEAMEGDRVVCAQLQMFGCQSRVVHPLRKRLKARSPAVCISSCYYATGEQAICMDIGSSAIRAGFAGDERPRAVLKSVVGRQKAPPLMAESVIVRERYIGEDAQRRRGLFSMSYPVKRGRVKNWDDWTALVNHSYRNELRVQPEEHIAIFSEPIFTPFEDTLRKMEIMFEELAVPMLGLPASPFLCAYSRGVTTACIVECGAGLTTCCPLSEAYCKSESVTQMKLGGKDITRKFIEQARLHGSPSFDFTSSCARRCIADDAKEKVCRLLGPERSQPRGVQSDYASYELPDGTVLNMNERAVHIPPEIMFHPELADLDYPSLPQLVYNCLMDLNSDWRAEILPLIYLVGGNTYEESPARLEAGLRELMKDTHPNPNIRVKRSEDDDRGYETWIGLSIMASFTCHTPGVFSVDQYDEHGPHSKFIRDIVR